MTAAHAIGTGFTCAGLFLAVIGFALWHFDPGARGPGIVAVACLVRVVGLILGDAHPGYLALEAGLFAGAVWAWWHRGGGDGTRRRLRRAARAFQGVRRTAPAAGAA